MTENEAYSLIETVSYRPGHRLDFRRDIISDAYILTLLAHPPCAYKRDGTTLRIVSSSMVPAPRLKEFSVFEFKKFIYQIITRYELHEAGEWLLFNGERTFDPHS